MDIDRTVDRTQVPGCRDRLGQTAAAVLFRKERLTLEVAFVDVVAIGNCDASDPRAHEYFRNH